MKRSYWKSIVRKKTITVTQALAFCVVVEPIGAKCWGRLGNPRGTRSNARRLRPSRPAQSPCKPRRFAARPNASSRPKHQLVHSPGNKVPGLVYNLDHL